MRERVAGGTRPDQITVLVSDRTQRRVYESALAQSDLQAAGGVTITTFYGLCQRAVALYWPLIAPSAGFAQPEREPVFLTVETTQHHMAQVVQPLIDETGQAVLAEWGEYRSPRDGAQVVLTIDRNVQLEAERLLTEALDTYEALRGNILVLDPRTGAVLAMANLPGVNLETLEELQTGDFWRVANTAASAIYEPGSVIKPITLAAALETRSVLPTDTYDDRGEMWVGGRRVANMGDVPYGQLNWTQMLARSAAWLSGSVAMLK